MQQATYGDDRVVLLHGSAGSARLWRQIAEKLDGGWRIIAPDLIGYGSGPAWPLGRPLTLDDEVRALLPDLKAPGRLHLVGYSYGGAVALHAAMSQPLQLASLALIDPVYFPILRYGGEEEALRRLQAVRDIFIAGMDGGRRYDAMGEFVDFWAGAGAWLAMRDDIRAGMAAAADKVVLDWQACFAAEPHLGRLAALGPRTILIGGDRSPGPMRRLVDALGRLMPGCRRVEVAGAGHLLPITHPPVLTGTLQSHFLGLS